MMQRKKNVKYHDCDITEYTYIFIRSKRATNKQENKQQKATANKH